LDEYAMRNPRIPLLINGKPGNVVFDYMVLDEKAMDHDDFYAGFLAPTGFRYCVGGTIDVSPREGSLFSVQRAAKQGHVGRPEIATMRLLLPHVRQAFDTMRRLREARARDRSFKAALDCFADGAALVRTDGTIVYANQALQAIARCGDGIRIARGRLEFAAAAADAGYAGALAALARTRRGDIGVEAATNVVVQRTSGAPPYLVAIRPLPRPGRHRVEVLAEATVFVRDPLRRQETSIDVLHDFFGFTPAEASVARALQAGVSLADYARQSGLSFNTVYTHLRHIKDKTQTSRQAELIRTLNDIRLPLRDE
jgi:DNA-binding CsgD family transcriptional regulator